MTRGRLAKRVRPIGTVLRAAFRGDPVRAVISLFLFVATGLGGPSFAFFLGRLADALGTGSDARVAMFGAGLALSLTLIVVVSEMAWKVVFSVSERAAHVLEQDLLLTMMSTPQIEHYERPDYLDTIDHLRDESWALSQALPMFLASVQLVITLSVVCLLLVTASPLLLFLPLFAVPTILMNAKAERIRVSMIDSVRPQWRRTDYLLEVLTSPVSAKEVRVFGLDQELLDRHAEASRLSYEAEFGARLRGAKYIVFGRLLFVVAYAAAVLLVVSRVTKDAASLGQVLMLVTLAGQLLTQVARIASFATWLRMAMTAVHRYLWVIDYGADQRPVSAPVVVPDELRDGVRLENVRFVYPGTDTPVLEDVSLELPRGSTVALIGENGAGKTTLVKLLSGMYRPSSGRITVDGVDLQQFDPAEWRERVSAAFQDHARLELAAQETVGVGDLPRIGEEPPVVASVERAGATDVIERLPERLRTQLGAAWPDGVDLSGGQWQKLALARGLMRAPLLLILDEPTSALDAETEHALFERFAAARDTAQEYGTITLLVSHRFSTVRMADVIVVLSEGRILESGSHRELMARGGLYAELFEMQARAYR